MYNENVLTFTLFIVHHNICHLFDALQYTIGLLLRAFSICYTNTRPCPCISCFCVAWEVVVRSKIHETKRKSSVQVNIHRWSDTSEELGYFRIRACRWRYKHSTVVAVCLHQDTCSLALQNNSNTVFTSCPFYFDSNETTKNLTLRESRICVLWNICVTGAARKCPPQN